MRPKSPLLPATCFLTASFALATPVHAAGPFSFHHDHVLGTSLDLQVSASSPDLAQAAHQAVLAEVERLCAILSTYDPDTDASRLNAAPVGQPIHVVPELLDVLRLYNTWRDRTNGAYTPGIAGLLHLWKDAESRHTTPSPAAIAREVATLHQPLFLIDPSAGTVQRTTGQRLNIDSLGKGFIVSRVLAAAHAKVPAVRGMLLNIGGDIATTGYSLLDRQVKWRIPIADPLHPQDNAAPFATLVLSNLAVATSGGYARGYAINGIRYSHILDPRTGRPADLDATGAPRKWAVASATVVAPDCATANALATSLCVLTPEEGLALVQKTEGAECLLVLADGAHLRSDGFRKYEVPRTDHLEQSMLADRDGPRWPAGFSVNITLKVKPEVERNAERPYIAVWIEDDQRQHVATLAVWGNDPRWLRQMPGWWKFGRTDAHLVAAVTRATRPAGEYRFAWDGKDQLGRLLPQGDYRVCVEADYDHGGRVYHSALIHCGDQPARASIEPSDTFDIVPLTYSLVKGAQ